MKSIKTKKSNSKKILFIALLALLGVLVAGAASYQYFNRSKQTNSSLTTQDDTKTPQSTPQAGSNVDSKDVQQPVRNDANTGASSSKQVVGVSITSKYQSSTTLQIRTIIDSLTTEGVCNLTLTKGSDQVTKTSGVQAGPSTSTCAGFDIPLSELSRGTWDIEIKFENSKSIGSLSSERVILE